MSTVNVAEGRALLAKATAGPWSTTGAEDGDACIWGNDGRWLANVGNWLRQSVKIVHAYDGGEISLEEVSKQAIEADTHDSAAIVWLRNNADALLDAAERKESRVAPLLEALSVAIGAFNDMRHGRSARLSNDAMWRLLCAARDAYTTVQSSEP